MFTPLRILLSPALLALAVLLTPAPVRSRPVGAIVLGGPTTPDGSAEVACDLPVDQRIKNRGSDVPPHAGMCVMSSIEMAARWAGLEQMRGLRDWCAKQPGGGYPSKVDRQLQEFCRERGLVCPEYAQEENARLETVQAVLASGRIACVTYAGQDGARYRGPIAHMVCAVHCDERHVGLLDNNAVGENELLWMSPRDFETRFADRGGGWVFWWSAPPPPPVPHN
jgi:hypothetical protein